MLLFIIILDISYQKLKLYYYVWELINRRPNVSSAHNSDNEN